MSNEGVGTRPRTRDVPTSSRNTPSLLSGGLMIVTNPYCSKCRLTGRLCHRSFCRECGQLVREHAPNRELAELDVHPHLCLPHGHWGIIKALQDGEEVKHAS